MILFTSVREPLELSFGSHLTGHAYMPYYQTREMEQNQEPFLHLERLPEEILFDVILLLGSPQEVFKFVVNI